MSFIAVCTTSVHDAHAEDETCAGVTRVLLALTFDKDHIFNLV